MGAGAASVTLFKHQSEAIQFALSRKGCAAIFHEMGLGKTRTAIEIYRELRAVTPGLRMIVVCPLSLLEAAWGADIRRFAPALQYHNWHKDGAPESNKGVRVADIILINYEAFIAEKNLKEIQRFVSRGIWMIVCDESSRLKNPKSKTAKALLGIRDKFRYRLVMSGTPAPNCETEYWAQMEFVRPGLLHPSFFAFRNTYFHLGRNGQKLIQQGAFLTRTAARELFSKGFKYEITPAKRKALMDRINPLCHFAKKINCLDLPDQIDTVREVQMTQRQLATYNEMKRHLITEISGSQITAQAALTKIMKLREITSGFAIDRDGEAKEIGESPKIDELLNIVEEIGNQQVIIWANFHWEIRKIREMLSPVGRAVTLCAETEERNESIADFLAGNARFLIAHPRSAAHGLTFINCSFEVFFSLDYSWEAYEQARARIHRAGQKKNCTYIHLIAKNSIDEAVLAVLKKKQDAQDIIYQLFKGEPGLQKAS